MGWLNMFVKPQNSRTARIKRVLILIVIILIAALIAFPTYRYLSKPRLPGAMQVPASTVILLTFDGVRPQELLRGADPLLAPDIAGQPIMPYLMTELAPQGVFLGDEAAGSYFHIGNPMGISMPGYQALFSGRFKPCVRNECGPVTQNTLLTKVSDELQPQPVFLSGYHAVCRGVGAPTVSQHAVCGPFELSAFARLQGMQSSRSVDEMVINLGLKRLESDPPPFIYLGLDESDSTGHSGNYLSHTAVLQRYDGYLQRIWAKVTEMNAKGHPTTLILTVDHGRGRGAGWTDHRWNVPGTGDIWIFAAGHGVAARGILQNTQTHSLYDVRPTVEYLLGLQPETGFWGNVITEFLDMQRR